MLRPFIQKELSATRLAMHLLHEAVLCVEPSYKKGPKVLCPDAVLLSAEQLVVLADMFGEQSKISQATISNKICDHTRLFSRLADGKSCTLSTSLMAAQWFSDHWPDAMLEWPTDIPRPSPNKQAASSVPGLLTTPECCSTPGAFHKLVPETPSVFDHAFADGDGPDARFQAARRRGHLIRFLQSLDDHWIGDVIGAASLFGILFVGIFIVWATQ